MGARSIRTRILAAFFGALIALSSTLVIGIRQMADLGAEIQAVNTGFLPMSKVGVELGALVAQLDRDHDRFARPMAATQAGRRANAGLYRAAIHEAVSTGRASAETAQAGLHNPSDHEVIKRILVVLTELELQSSTYETAVNTWLIAQEAGDTDQALRLLADLDRRRSALAAGAALTQALVEGQIERISQRTANSQRRAMAVSITLGIVSVMLSALLALVALRALRPISTLITQVQKVAAGDLTGSVTLQSQDEMGLLAKEFNTMSAAVAERDQSLMDRAQSLDELQARLRQVIDTITAGLVVLDGDQILMLNHAATRLWGLTDQHAVPDWMAALGLGHHEGIAVDQRLFSVTVVRFAQAGTLIVAADVTEAEAVRTRLQRSERLALVGQMLAQITHEVRNPLNAMSLNAEMLMDEVEGSEATAMLTTITEEIRRLERLTERYLHLSKKRVPERQKHTPSVLVRGIVKAEAAALAQSALMVEVFGPVDDSPVNIDADAITRAVRNLLRNAAEAGANGVAIQIKTARQGLEITLTDDGPGLSGAQLTQAFDPFFSTKSRGTGLGLAISRQELEEIGGGLHLDDTHRQGARFVIWIPTKA